MNANTGRSAINPLTITKVDLEWRSSGEMSLPHRGLEFEREMFYAVVAPFVFRLGAFYGTNWLASKSLIFSVDTSRNERLSLTLDKTTGEQFVRGLHLKGSPSHSIATWDGQILSCPRKTLLPASYRVEICCGVDRLRQKKNSWASQRICDLQWCSETDSIHKEMISMRKTYLQTRDVGSAPIVVKFKFHVFLSKKKNNRIHP